MLSIDITDRQIKLVRGINSGNKIRVQEADIRELTIGMVANGYISDIPMVASELNDIIKAKGIKEKEVIVSITSSSIVYKELMLPKPKNMKNSVAIEAMIQSNMGITNEYNISYTIAGEAVDENKNALIKVLATACPQRLVDGYVRLFTHVGLSLKAINVANNSITRLMLNTPKMADRMPLLLVQIDKEFLNVNLFEDNQLVFSRYFKVDPMEYDNAPDYINRAIYDNLFRMIQFIKMRKDSKPLKEIMFYGEIFDFISLTNAIAQFNVPTHILNTPSTVITMCEIDFSKYANAIGAIYKENKVYEHINLLDATSAKESKGINGFLFALAGSVLAAAGACFVATLIANNINDGKLAEIAQLDSQINAPALQTDLAIVDSRAAMVAGFTQYKDSVEQATNLFNFMPKNVSLVMDRVKEPFEEINKMKDCSIQLVDYSINEYEVNILLNGTSMGDPSTIPSTYIEMLNNVMGADGNPYFQNISYNGFTKKNSDEEAIVDNLEKGTEKETVFEFSVTMRIKAGNDEEYAVFKVETTEEEVAADENE